MRTIARLIILNSFLLSILLSGCTSLRDLQKEDIGRFRDDVAAGRAGFLLPAGARLDTIGVDSAAREITVRFNRQFGITPFRPANVAALYDRVKPYFTEHFEGFRVALQMRDLPVESLIPNYFRNDPATIDSSRLPRPGRIRPRQVVTNISRSRSRTLAVMKRDGCA